MAGRNDLQQEVAMPSAYCFLAGQLNMQHL
jgi:hypothetical protein